MRVPIGVLDLSPVPSGEDARAAIAHTIDLARHAESLGFTRYWLAEHHNAGGLACTSPEILIGAVAGATSTMRVGAGGIMLPNHAPLRVAEAFKTLEALHPSRIDLGLGRAAGTDKKTALALRRHPSLLEDTFDAQLEELLSLLTFHPDPSLPFNPTKASPLGIAPPEIWVLGASVASARRAAERGLAYAYAHHFAPADAAAALRAYRDAFRPSAVRKEPRTILAASVICGGTDDEADALASSASLFFLRAGRGLRDLPLPSASEATAYPYDDDERALLAQHRTAAIVGGPARVRSALERLLGETGADELLVTSIIHDHQARIASYARLAELLRTPSPR